MVNYVGSKYRYSQYELNYEGANRLLVAREMIRNIQENDKFGRAPQGVQITSTDIWDRADATPTQQIWLCPTAPRIHQIASTDAGDTAAGAGCRTVEITGLKEWTDTSYSTETVTMAGLGNSPTASAWAIIHRMRPLTYGASGPNIGTITATADTDGTITAVVLPGIGSTEMAIMGIPTGRTLFLDNWWASMMRSGGSGQDVRVRLMYCPDPATTPTVFHVEETRGLTSTGTSSETWDIKYMMRFTGPGIIKINAIGSAADIDMSAGWHGVISTTESQM